MMNDFLAILLPIFVPMVVLIAALFLFFFELKVLIDVISNHRFSILKKLVWSIAILFIQPVGAFLCFMRLNVRTHYKSYVNELRF